MRRARTSRVAIATAAATLALSGAAHGQSAPDDGKAFEPQPLSQPIYGVAEKPIESWVVADDETRLHLETYLPVAEGGHTPPKRVPTILIATPYDGLPAPFTHPEDHLDLARYVVPRGYALTVASVRGTGHSGGCIQFMGPVEHDDLARIIEFIGKGEEASWSDGNVGMHGLSYEGTTPIEAAISADRARTRYLKAIVSIAGMRSAYEMSAADGVPLMRTFRHAFYGAYQGRVAAPYGTPGAELAGRADCATSPPSAEASLAHGMHPYWLERDLRAGVQNVRTPILFAQGLTDPNVRPVHDVGFTDRLHSSVPVKGVVGQWEHMFPDRQEQTAAWRRADWRKMVVAWFDRWLKELPTGAEAWPDVQVQDTTGQWREERAWPTTGGPAGQLALGPDGRLGDTQPEGSTAYSEVSKAEDDGAVWDTGPLPAPLHLTGQPSLQLWTILDRPKAHVAVRLDAYDAAGRSLLPTANVGLRSAEFLDPIAGGRFTQVTPRAPDISEPVEIPVRLTPLDVVVPAGGRVVLRIGGSTEVPTGAMPVPSEPSGATGQVQVLHDCQRPSVLRFTLPHPGASLLNVRETDEDDEQPLESSAARPAEGSGGGLATAPVCGRAAKRDDVLGPSRTPATEGLTVRVRPARARGLRTLRLKVRVSRRGRPVAGVRVSVGRVSARTGARGRARLRWKPRMAGRHHVVARRGALRGRTVVTVKRAG